MNEVSSDREIGREEMMVEEVLRGRRSTDRVRLVTQREGTSYAEYHLHGWSMIPRLCVRSILYLIALSSYPRPSLILGTIAMHCV